MSDTTSASELFAVLHEHKVIPDVIPTELAGAIKGPISVIYHSDHIASLGTELPRAETLTTPRLEFKEAEKGATYTIIMTDPDMLYTHDTLSGQVRHWLQTGVSFDPATKRSVIGHHASTPQLTTDHIGPTPGVFPLAFKHRYVFLAAREPENYKPDFDKPFPIGPSDLKGRMQFDAAAYMKEEGLILQGVALMLVSADAKSAVENVQLGVETLVNKVMGK